MTNQLDLYQQVILEHNRKPRNFGKLAAPSHQAEGFNPLCGDHLWIYLTLADQAATAGDDTMANTIAEVAFEGAGCAISKASASMMTAALKGKTVQEAQLLFEEFQKLLKGELDPEAPGHSLGKLKIFAGIWQYPSRIKCAGLAWHTLKGALDAKPEAISTE